LFESKELLKWQVIFIVGFSNIKANVGKQAPKRSLDKKRFGIVVKKSLPYSRVQMFHAGVPKCLAVFRFLVCFLVGSFLLAQTSFSLMALAPPEKVTLRLRSSPSIRQIDCLLVLIGRRFLIDT
jgi:hypothetical protein